MLGMGLTLKWEDFKGVFTMPKWVITGVVLQFVVMPVLGFGLGRLFDLPTPFKVGLILVACCPGGTASNVIAYLSKANVALSVTMTTLSTIVAIVATPLLTGMLVGSTVEVDRMSLFLDMITIVLLPVVAGLLMNWLMPKLASSAARFSPGVAVIAIVMIVAAIVGAGKENIIKGGFALIGAVVTLHLAGFIIGYLLARMAFKREDVARTISIEVGMQNSGLGVVLARQNFTNPLTPIPSAISSLTHCVIGSVLAWVWSRKGEDSTLS